MKNKIIFILLALLIFIPNVMADDVDTSECTSEDSCKLTTDDFTLEIKGFELYNLEGNKISDIDTWTLNPEYTSQSKDDVTGKFLKLNADFSTLDTIVKNNTTTPFEGEIKINYKITYNNLKSYSYFVDDVEDIFALLLMPSSVKMSGTTKEGSAKYYYVKMNSSNQVTISPDYSFTSTDEDSGLESTTSGSYLLGVMTADNEFSVDASTYPCTMIAISDTEFDEEEISSLTYGTNSSGGESALSNNQIKEENTSVKPENSGVKNSKTGVISILSIILMLSISIFLLTYTKTKILKRHL